jgi:hypothetical protein
MSCLLLYDSPFKGIVPQDEYFFEGIKNQISTFYKRADSLIILLPCYGKNKR